MPEKQITQVVSLSYSCGILSEPGSDGGMRHFSSGRRFLSMHIDFKDHLQGLGDPQSEVEINGTWYVKACPADQAFLKQRFSQGGTGGLLPREDTRHLYNFPPASCGWWS